MAWDNPRSSYKKHHYPTSCKHCWIWVKRNADYTSEEGEIFLGDYLAMACGHCNKYGPLICRWDESLHSNIPVGSKKGFFNIHNKRGCPSVSGKSQASRLEYEYDF